MSRKSQYISKLNNRDISSFRLLFFAHYVPRSLLKASDCRLRAYEKQGLVKKCISINTAEVIYKCTDKGRNYISKVDNFVGHKPYVNGHASEHNILLAKTIAELPKEKQEQWHSEKDLWYIYQSKLDELRYTDFEKWKMLINNINISPCDGGVVSESHIELVEIITNHYNATAIEAKEMFGQALSASVNYYHI